MNRWEWLEGVKAEPAARAIVRELGKVLAEELSQWPPRVEFSDDTVREKFALALDPDAGLPSLSVIDEAVKRVAWEVGRDFEAIEHYERNHRLEKALPDRRDQLAAVFLCSFLLEAFFDLMERTHGRVKRKDLLDGLEELGTRLRVAWQEPAGHSRSPGSPSS